MCHVKLQKRNKLQINQTFQKFYAKVSERKKNVLSLHPITESEVDMLCSGLWATFPLYVQDSK